jgi:AraC-like DNA-binding protein
MSAPITSPVLPTMPVLEEAGKWQGLRQALRHFLAAVTTFGDTILEPIPLAMRSGIAFLPIHDGYLVSRPRRERLPQLTFCLKGQRCFWLDGRWYLLMAGRGSFIPDGSPYFPYGWDGFRVIPCEFLNMAIFPSGVILFLAGLTERTHFRSAPYVVADQEAVRLFHRWRTTAVGKRSERAKWLTDFLERLTDATPVALDLLERPNLFASPFCSPILQRAIGILHQAYHLPITLKQVANWSFVSPFYLCRLFRRILGKTFWAYLRGLRMHLAATLLQRTDLGVRDVAFMVGYQEVAQFRRAFRKVMGRSPTRLRQRRGRNRFYLPPKGQYLPPSFT